MATQPHPSSRQAQQQTPLVSLASITSKGAGKPNRWVLHAVEGFGKTTLGAHFPKPIFFQSKGETGLETLIDNRRLGDVPHFPESQEWSELLSGLTALDREAHDFKTVVVDTINGAERMCQEHVCARDFNNNWIEFGAYGKGPEVALADWRVLLNKLDALRDKGMGVVLLCHTRVKGFKNPTGADYDRYQPDMGDKAWGLTHKWADVVLFGNFETLVVGKNNSVVADSSKKGKGMGGKQRVLYTVRDAAYDAKNRLGLPQEIALPDSPAEAWTAFSSAVKHAKEHSNG
jgi:hypothetical protein